MKAMRLPLLHPRPETCVLQQQQRSHGEMASSSQRCMQATVSDMSTALLPRK